MWKLSLFLCHILRDTKEAKDHCQLYAEWAIVLEVRSLQRNKCHYLENVDLMIGIRLHLQYFSSLLETQLLVFPYDPKDYKLLHMIGQKPMAQ